MLFDVSNNPLLPAGLAGPILATHVMVAELILELRGQGGELRPLGDPPVIDQPEDIADAANAVALQVATQFEADPEAAYATKVARGTESVEYRAGVLRNPIAASIVQTLFTKLAAEGPPVSAWPVIRGWRGGE